MFVGHCDGKAKRNANPVQTTGILGVSRGFAETLFDGGTPCSVAEVSGEWVSAKELCLSVETISSYRANILLKTRMKNNAEITHHAFYNKLLD